MRGRHIVFLATALLILAITSIIAVRKRQPPRAVKAAEPTRKTAQPVEISLQGQIRARDLVRVAAPIEGRVVAFHAEVGADVYEGQLLADIRSDGLTTSQEAATNELERSQERVNNLESAISAARLEASRAAADATRSREEFDRASRNYTRQKMLIGEGATPRQVFERSEKEYLTLQEEAKNTDEVSRNADARVSSLQTELDNARKLLDDRTRDLEAAKARVDAGQVFSPVNGVVAARRGDVGEQVNPAMNDLFQIATNLSSLHVAVQPAPADLPRIRPGQPALISVADLPNEAISGTVSSVANGEVTVEFANPSPLVKPGHTAQVRIRLT